MKTNDDNVGNIVCVFSFNKARHDEFLFFWLPGENVIIIMLSQIIVRLIDMFEHLFTRNGCKKITSYFFCRDIIWKLRMAC